MNQVEENAKEFNLLDEPWIRVLKQDHATVEVSLRDLLANAAEYKSLAGELPTQDVALLRLALAVLYAVFLRWDINGDENPIAESEDEDVDLEEPFIRWKALWDMGHFPMDVLDDYFAAWHERFWLFHPERPFYQVSALEVGTDYGASKLNGDLSESSNKTRLFRNYNGIARDTLSYAEAARWLPHLIGIDDTSSKPKQKGLESPGAGWLGALGLVYMEGRTLFETLMLNLAFLRDGEALWEDGSATWELDKVRSAERTRIPLPYAPTELYTLQSRRIKLHRENGRVTGYCLLGGDFFEKEQAFAEQMTFWRENIDKKTGSIYLPRRHKHGVQLWREFSTMIGHDTRMPGVLRWVKVLQENRILSPMIGTCHIASVQYGDKDFFVQHVFDDSVSYSLDLLTSMQETKRTRVEEEIKLASDLAKLLENLAKDLLKAKSGGGEKREKEFNRAAQIAREQFYSEIDMPFRKWLLDIDTSDDAPASMEAYCIQWRKIEKRIAENIAYDMVIAAGDSAFIGHTVKDKTTERLYAAPDRYNWFTYMMNKILNIPKEEPAP